MIATQIFVIFILILVNVFLALCEIAIVSTSKPMLRQAMRQGSKRAAAALKLADEPGRYLSTMQVGMTLVSIMAGVYGEGSLAHHVVPFFETIDFIGPAYAEIVTTVVVVGGITYLTVVLGELVPKQFAMRHPERVAMVVAPLMIGITLLLSPVVWVLEFSARWILRLLGIRHGDEDSVTEEEVKAILTESAETGVIEKTEHEMLQRVIRLGDREIKSIMTHRQDVVFINIDSNLEEIREKIHEAGHSRYPVIEEGPDNVVGIIQAKDMLDDILTTHTFNIRAHMKDIYAVPENATCLSALDHFKRSNINLMIIVDEYGSTQGIVTPSDFLESIVGILPSNYGEDHEAMIVQREDGSWLVDGRTPIEEIHLSIGLPEISADEDFDTIAGFVLDYLRKTPKVADAFEVFNYRFEIMDMDGRRIDKVLIQKQEISENGDGV